MTSDIPPLEHLFILTNTPFGQSIKSFIGKYLKVDLITFGVHIVCAVLIIACITFWVWKPTSDFIDANKKKLDKDREELIINTRETRYFLGLLKKEKIKLSSMRVKMEMEARNESEKLMKLAKKNAKEYEENLRKDAEYKILAMEEKAKNKINGVVRELALELTEKLIEANINDDTNKALIDSYIKDLEKKRISSERI